MTRIAYVNGRYVAHGDALVHVEDRGYQFADGVYEVCAIENGVPLDEVAHLDRLERSLGALRIAMPMTRRALGIVLREVARRNHLSQGLIYVQVSRGVAPRDHGFPGADVAPSLVVTARPMNFAQGDALAERGVGVITVPETRWARVDIKTIGLLPNVLAKQAAREAGATEAWFVDAQGFVTEGASSNAWIVDGEGRLITRDLGRILAGVTRAALIEIAAEVGIPVIERPFTVAEAQGAREAFISSATAFVLPVVAIDGRPIGNGAPGSVVTDLRARYRARGGAVAEA